MAEIKQSAPDDMSVHSNRVDLIRRYNLCVRTPGHEANGVQNDFLNGVMDPRFVASFVADFEVIIESRRLMHKPLGD